MTWCSPRCSTSRGIGPVHGHLDWPRLLLLLLLLLLLGKTRVDAHLAHGREETLCLLDELGVPCALGLFHATNDVFESLLVRSPFLDKRLLGLGSPGSCLHGVSLCRRLAAGRSRGFGCLLALPTLGLLILGGPGRSSWKPVIVVYTAHMVPKIPLTGKAVSGNGAVATFVGAEERLVAMPMHRVSLPLVSKKTGGRGEPRILASRVLAPIGLQMGVDKFTEVKSTHVSMYLAGKEKERCSCCTFKGHNFDLGDWRWKSKIAAGGGLTLTHNYT